MKMVLITGATGFIGSHLMDRNLKEGNKVRILALPHDPVAKDYEDRGVEVIYGDIRDEQAVDRAVEGMQIVFHLAAVVTDWAPERLFEEVNVGGTRNVCKACIKHNVDRLVEVSTNDVFGLREDMPIDETFDYACWGEPYADTKMEAIKATHEYMERGLSVSSVFPCWVYGPGDRTFIPLLADAIKSRSMLFWRKDVIVWPAYVENVIDLLMLIAEHPDADGEGFLVHDGESDTLQNFCTKIAEAIGEKAPKLHVPYWTAYSIAAMMELVWKLLHRRSRPLLTKYTVKNLGSRLRFSIQKAEKRLGWHPRFRYPEAFEMTMAWLNKTDPEMWKQK